MARGATYLFLQGLVSSLAGVVYFAFAARLLPSVADLGRLATLGMLNALFSTVGCLALPSAVVKFVSEHMGGGRSGEAGGVFWSSFRAGFVLALGSSLVCFVGSRPLASYLLGSDEYAALFYLLSVDVFLVVLWPFLQASLQGLQEFGQMAAIGVANSILRNGVGILALVLGLGLIGVLLGWVLGDLTATVISALLAFRAFRDRGPQKLGPMIRYSAPLYVSSLLMYLVGSVDRYLILLLAGQAVLGVYSPAVTASSVLGIVSGAIGSSLFPLLSEKYGGLGREALGDVSRISSRYVFLVYVPLAFGMAATAYPTMALFVGERFSEGAMPLAILAVASALACGGVVVNNVLLAMGRTSVFSVVSLLSVVSDVALSLLLIGSLGAVGAAIARTSTILISFVFPALFLARLLGPHLDLTAFVKSLVASSLMALAVAGLQLAWSSRYLLPLYVVVGGLVYLAMLRALRALREDDFVLARGFVPARARGLVDLAHRFLT